MSLAHADYAIYRDVVGQLMDGQEQLPSLPSITLDIRRALEMPSTSFLSLSKLIARDPSLSAILLKYASSALLHTAKPPQTIFDVVRVLGLPQVERITMAHSVKSLFTMHSAQHKRLFIMAWERLILKASTSAFLAKTLSRRVAPDHALLASLLSEIGTLAVLSAFKSKAQIPSLDVYIALCREYSKSLGIIMLKKWQVGDEYVQVVRKTGEWSADADEPFGLIDVVNLGLYHALKFNKAQGLPSIQELSAYQKLYPPHNFVTDTSELISVTSRREEINIIAKSLHFR